LKEFSKEYKKFKQFDIIALLSTNESNGNGACYRDASLTRKHISLSHFAATINTDRFSRLNQLLEAVQQLERQSAACIKAGRSFVELLTQNFFMPLAVTMLAALARVFVLTLSLATTLMNAYDTEMQPLKSGTEVGAAVALPSSMIEFQQRFRSMQREFAPLAIPEDENIVASASLLRTATSVTVTSEVERTQATTTTASSTSASTTVNTIPSVLAKPKVQQSSATTPVAKQIAKPSVSSSTTPISSTKLGLLLKATTSMNPSTTSASSKSTDAIKKSSTTATPKTPSKVDDVFSALLGGGGGGSSSSFSSAKQQSQPSTQKKRSNVVDNDAIAKKRKQ
jgi:hypothetical protein